MDGWTWNCILFSEIWVNKLGSSHHIMSWSRRLFSTWLSAKKQRASTVACFVLFCFFGWIWRRPKNLSPIIEPLCPMLKALATVCNIRLQRADKAQVLIPPRTRTLRGPITPTTNELPRILRKSSFSVKFIHSKFPETSQWAGELCGPNEPTDSLTTPKQHLAKVETTTVLAWLF